jgi:ubiquitin carboxyl-terminal hydrolase 22/27/51
VQFPLELNMLPYTSRAKGQDVRENFELARSCVYDLISVVVHVGEMDTGHYVSYCRVGDQVSYFMPHGGKDILTRRKWFAFNDHKVELAQKSDVLNSRAYLLFYIVRSLS